MRQALETLAASAPPDRLEPVDREWLTGGYEIERDPEPFLSTGMCSRRWPEASPPVLRDAAETAPVGGDALLHLDVRSDNICLTERGAVLVDWNLACIGNPEPDVAAGCQSLRLEGGARTGRRSSPAEAAAVLAGFFGSRVGLPPPPTAPQVREIQRQLEIALARAARELDLSIDRWARPTSCR